MSVLEIPSHLDHLTAEFLEKALQRQFPGTKVRSVHIGTVIHGTATKVRLLLDYDQTGHAHRLPPTMWFKGGLEDHSQSADMLQVYAGEAAFYDEIAGDIDVSLPRGFAAELDLDSGASFVILEDLLARNARFGRALSPFAIDEMQNLVVEMAKLHGACWQAPELATKTWLQNGGSLLQSCEAVITKESWTRCSQLPRAEFVGKAFSNFALFREFVLNALRSDAAQPLCLVHGDCHIGNTFTDGDGKIGLLDWQSTMLGHWAHDVAYAIITGLTVEDRRHHEKQLIEFYVAQMAPRGVAIDRDLAWREYRKHTAYSCAWAICLPEWQAEEICCAVVERAFAAADDLDSLNAWST